MAHILIVDDEDVFLDFATWVLKAAGHTVTMTSSPKLVPELVATQVPDLIVSDINMPGMSGFELAAAINSDPEKQWIPVVFMSSRSDATSFREAFGAGAVDYLVKPFSRQNLVETVERKLQETEHRRAAFAKNKPSALPHIPGYTLSNPLGAGGMSHVYLAEKGKTGERCALKVLTIVDEGREQARVLARFLEERALLARIDHPNVAKVFDHGISDDHVYIAMEYFPRGDLKAALAEGISITTSLAYVRQIAEGLGKVHSLGIIHRDIKPANIMLRGDGTVALVDFGIAKELNAASTLTRHGETLGTPHYMSPEQINSQPLDARSDLYSLGAMFFEMLTQAPPFRGDRLESVLMQHLHAPRPILPRNLSILQPLLDRMLAVDPAHRHPDTVAFLKEFSVVEMMRFSEHTNVRDASFSGMVSLDTLPKT